MYRSSLTALVAAFAATLAVPSWAGPNDDAASALVKRAFSANPKKNPRKSKALLDLAKRMCSSGCGRQLTAKIAIGHGTLLAYGGQKEAAKKQFEQALKDNPRARLVRGHQSGPVKSAFQAARGKGVKPSPRSRKASPKQLKTRPKRRKQVRECETGRGRPPAGWRSNKGFCYFSEAVASEASQEWGACADYASRSVDAEARSTTRYLGAQCSERAGRLVEALKGFNLVVSQATREGKRKTAAAARKHASAIEGKIPKLVVVAPPDAKNLRVVLDGNAVSTDQLGGEIWSDPGQHTLRAQGIVNGKPLNVNRTVTLRSGQTTTIDLGHGGSSASTDPMEDPRVARCMAETSSPSELAKCLETDEPSDVITTVSSELSGYMDSDAVEVLSPSVALSVEHPTDGWGVGAAFLVDVVTAASADIVSTASPRWSEVRYVPALNAHKKWGDFDLSGNAVVSVEPDYLALGAGLSGALDLAQKNAVASLRYDFGYDIQGRSNTPFDVFSEKIHRHGITGAVTLVLDKASIFVPALTTVFEFGDTSKPYRYLPTFIEGTEVAKGETPASVDAKRTPAAIADQLPDTRQRYALAGLYARRMSSITLRLSERVYVDSWGVMASTTDFLLPWDITKSFRMWPHLRFHVQKGVDFWERGYKVQITNANQVIIPLLRTGDRELGPMLTGTAGVGSRIEIDDSYGLILKGDVMYTRFLDHLYQQGRFGGFGGATVEAVFD